jgi:prepilin-type N-terminal cleavage/methylation domain-containing protein
MDPDVPMTNVVSAPRRRTQLRRGMTLIEVILAIVILSGAMLGLANFGRKFQHLTAVSSNQTLASDLATQRLEDVKGFRVYSSLVATYNATTEVVPALDSAYIGFQRVTTVARCALCPTATNDYVTVTVAVTLLADSTFTPIKKTTIIAKF